MLTIGGNFDPAVSVCHGLLNSPLKNAGINPGAILQTIDYYCRFI
jgi:hypothetical protein